MNNGLVGGQFSNSTVRCLCFIQIFQIKFAVCGFQIYILIHFCLLNLETAEKVVLKYLPIKVYLSVSSCNSSCFLFLYFQTVLIAINIFRTFHLPDINLFKLHNDTFQYLVMLLILKSILNCFNYVVITIYNPFWLVVFLFYPFILSIFQSYLLDFSL